MCVCVCVFIYIYRLRIRSRNSDTFLDSETESTCTISYSVMSLMAHLGQYKRNRPQLFGQGQNYHKTTHLYGNCLFWDMILVTVGNLIV